MTRTLATLLLVVVSSAASSETFQTLPDGSLTLGWTVAGITLHTVCTTRWGDDARVVIAKMKQDAMDAHHFDLRTCPLSNFKKKRLRRVEIDHLVPRSPGEADDERNLWPQCYELTKKKKSQQDDGAHKKEAFLHKGACTKQSAALLQTYQQGMKSNWLDIYHEIYGNN